jgi:CYTH domain-containing protein
MPIENEVKFLLNDPEAVLALTGGRWVPIQQGYLPGDARIRRKNVGSAYREAGDDIFTYKIATRHGLIEIETAISEQDADRLWEIADRKISKTRLTLFSPEGDQWDIDVFLDDVGLSYLAMAECEMPEGQDAPRWIPGAITTFIRRAIPREEQLLYTNVRLSDPNYAKALYDG